MGAVVVCSKWPGQSSSGNSRRCFPAFPPHCSRNIESSVVSIRWKRGSGPPSVRGTEKTGRRFCRTLCAKELTVTSE